MLNVNKSVLLTDYIFHIYFIAADSWPQVFDDSEARRDWNWKPEVGLDDLVTLMIKEVKEKMNGNGS